MPSERRYAIAAGILFLVATVLNLIGNAVMRPLIAQPVDLARIAADPTSILAGFVVKLVSYAACPAIALAMYPVLHRHGPAFALGSVAFRLLEAVFYTVAAVCALLLVALGRLAVAGGGAVDPFYQDLAAVLLAATDLLGFGVAVVFFALGALLYSAVLFQASLLPRWLSGWGIAAAVMALAASLLVLLDVAAPMSPLHLVLNLPIFAQELVLAGWLIVRGFRPAVAAALPAMATPAVAVAAS
ncbi:MAG TPA: DUF4386 domain-containing protein [Candidatus Limnocylindrales bacterium]